MKTWRHIVSAAAVAVAFAGCTSTGGTVGGLVPAPKLTQGKLSEGRYEARDGSFSVDVPFAPDGNAYRYMEIAEDYSADGNAVQFSTSVLPAEVYRMNTFTHVGGEQDVEEVMMANYRRYLESAYGTSFENPSTENIAIDGVPSVLRTFSQHIPERSQMGQAARALNVLHSCAYVAKENAGTHICVNRIAPGSDGASDGAEQRVRKFFLSFRLNEGAR